MNNAKLMFFHSVMGGGKTTLMLQKVYNDIQANKPGSIIVMKLSVDTRNDHIRSRAMPQNPLKAGLMVCSTTNIFALVQSLAVQPVAIYVDEANFLTRDQVFQLNKIVTILQISVHCFGLSTNFKREFFEGSRCLFEIADEVIECHSAINCSCGKSARFNARKVNGSFIFEGNSIAVEQGDITYVVLCKHCYEQEEEIYINSTQLT